MLRGLGEFIARRRRALLVVWIIVLVASIPLAANLNKVLIYSESAFMPKNVESLEAEDIMAKQFPHAEKTDLVILLIHDVKDPALRRAVKSFEKEAPSQVPQVKEVSSIYDVYDAMLAKYWEIMNKTYSEIYKGVLQGAMKLHENMYGLKENLTRLHEAVVMTKSQVITLHKNIQETKTSVAQALSLVYGVPDLYLHIWSNVLASTAAAAPQTPLQTVREKAILEAEKMMKTSSEPAKKYLEVFAQQLDKSIEKNLGGNLTAGKVAQAIAAGQLDPRRIGQSIVESLAPQILQQVPGLTGGMAERLVSSFNLDNYRDEQALKEFVVALFAEKMGGTMPRGVIEMLYDEGPELSSETLKKITRLLVSAAVASKGITMPSEIIDAVYDLGDNPSEQAWRSLIVGLTLKNAGRMGLNVTREFVEAVYDLGPSPTQQAYQQLAEKIASEKLQEITGQHPPPRFPDDIPPEIRGRMINENGTIMLLSVAFQPGYTSKELAHATEKLQELMNKTLEANGLGGVKTYFTGPPAFSLDLEKTTKGDVERIDKVTVVLVVVLLASLLASIVAPVIPLVTVGVAMSLALAALYMAGKYVIDIPYYIRNMITPILMGVGVDYSIYMLYRFREELDKEKSRDEATVEAVTYAGEAIVSAAFTVIVGFGALMASDFKMLRSMGFSLALAILLVLIAALTLTATILSLLGVKAFWPYRKKREKGGGLRAGYLRRAAETATRRPLAIITVFLVITAVSAGVLAGMHRTYDYTELMPETPSIKGFEIMREEFGLGGLSMLYAVVVSDKPLVENGLLTRDAYEMLTEFVTTIGFLPGVDNTSIISLVSPMGKPLEYNQVANISSNPAARNTLGIDGRTALIMFSLKYPSLSMKAFNTVQKVRKAGRSVAERWGAKLYVGGESAVMDDMNNLVNYEFTYKILPLAVIGVFIVLFLLLRSAKVALSLLLAIGTSIGWALALLVVGFQWIMGVDIYWLTPIMITTALLGLGMDYGIFLVTRVKEELDKGREKIDAIITAVETTGMVITACGIIMAAAFGSLGASSFKMLQEMGFAFAAAVLLDTFLVRPLFLPSILRIVRWRERKQESLHS